MKFLFMLTIGFIVLAGISGLRCQSKDKPTGQQQVLLEVRDYSRSVSFPSELIQQHINTIAAAPHPMGSPRQKEVLQYLKAEAEALGFPTMTDNFTASVPNPEALLPDAGPVNLGLEKKGSNLFAGGAGDRDCVILFASHYDSKFFSSFVYLGANDSASSSAALLWLLTAAQSFPRHHRFRCNIGAVWFDGEESYLPQWDDGLFRHPIKQQDNTYGSRHLADQMVSCQEDSKLRHCLPPTLGGLRLEALILLDMIGSPNVQLSRDSNSSPELRQTAKALAQALDMTELYTRSRPRAIIDDHVPFKEIGVPVINFIDFENLDVWHQPGDDPELVDIGSVEKVARLALALGLQVNMQD